MPLEASTWQTEAPAAEWQRAESIFYDKAGNQIDLHTVCIELQEMTAVKSVIRLGRQQRAVAQQDLPGGINVLLADQQVDVPELGHDPPQEQHGRSTHCPENIALVQVGSQRSQHLEFFVSLFHCLLLTNKKTP